MKKICMILVLIGFAFDSYGQIYTCTLPASITTNQTYICTDYLTISNSIIGNNATVTIKAREVTINPGFATTPGTNVTITASANPMTSDTYEQQAVVMETQSTDMDVIPLVKEVKAIKIYAVTGQLLYSSDNNTDIYSVGLSSGIYIVQKEYDTEELDQEKIVITAY